MIDKRDKFAKILGELEKEIKDPKDLEIAKNKILEVCMMFIDMNNKNVETNNGAYEDLYNKVEKLQKSIEKIEADIYIDEDEEKDDKENIYDKIGDQMHDNELNISYDDYDFEIKCPYCNYEFVIGPEANLKDIIECPKCHKEIELDWDDYCDGECGHCDNICYDKKLESDVLKEEENEYKDENNSKKVQDENKNTTKNTSKKKKQQNQDLNDNQNNSNIQNNENEDDM